MCCDMNHCSEYLLGFLVQNPVLEMLAAHMPPFLEQGSSDVKASAPDWQSLSRELRDVEEMVKPWVPPGS